MKSALVEWTARVGVSVSKEKERDESYDRERITGPVGVASAAGRHRVPRIRAGEHAAARLAGPGGRRVLASRGRGTRVLHRSPGPLSLPGGRPYAWSAAAGRRRSGAERSGADDGPDAVHQNGRDST